MVRYWPILKNTGALMVILLCLAPALLRGTAQSGDLLIWNGQRYPMFSAPLEKLPNFDSLRSKVVLTPQNKYATNCGRGYVAVWEFHKGYLYLQQLLDCMGSEVTSYPDLRKLFPQYVKNGQLCATWFSGELVLPQGKCLKEVHDGFMSIFEKDRVITVKNGKLVRDTVYNNGRSYKSVYCENADSLKAFVYSRINWQKIPDTVYNKKTVVIFRIPTGQNPKPDSLTFMKSSGCKPCDEEALRVMKLLPSWSVYYIARKNTYFPIYYNIPVIFTEENRRRYAPH